MPTRSLLKLLTAACISVPALCWVPFWQESKTRSNWHEDAFFGIHYDFHASAAHKEIGKDLTPDHLRERLLRVRPDWIHTDCKGVYGYTSWPTKVGARAPGLVKDTLRIYRDVTRELGMKLGVHFCSLWDERAIELHPEWAQVDARGQRSRQFICLTSPYADERMIPQMLEVIDNYDVDGFWVDADSWGAKACWCKRCKAEFTERTGITKIPTEKSQPRWKEWLNFHRCLYLAHVRKYADAIHTRKPSCMVTTAWMYGFWQPDSVKVPVDHLSGDAGDLWSTPLGSRTFDGRGLTWDLMPWSFVLLSDSEVNPPNAYKSALHLKLEVARIVALGGAVMIYEQPRPSGWLTGWHHEVMAEVADFARARKDLCFKSKTVPQVAVLHVADHYYAHTDDLHTDWSSPDASQPVKGALFALLEMRRSTDILIQDAALQRMSDYKLVVVPEQTHLSTQLVNALEAFARAGGHVLMTGDHLVRDYPRLVGASPSGQPLKTPVYLQVGSAAVGVSAPWQPVIPAPGTGVLYARLSGEDPEKNRTNDAVVTRRVIGSGVIVAIHGPIFKDYFLSRYQGLRRFIDQIVEEMKIEWRATVDPPARVELILREKDGKLLVNLVNRGAGEAYVEKREFFFEDLPAAENVVVRVRLDRQPNSVALVPADMEPTWTYSDGLATIKVPRVEIHRVVVVD